MDIVDSGDVVDIMDSVDNMDFVDRVDIVDRIITRSTLSMLSTMSMPSMPTIAHAIFPLIFRFVVDHDRGAACRWQTANHLCALDLCVFRSGGVPQLHPESSRLSVNGEC